MIGKHSSPRSHNIHTSRGTVLRRNRNYLRHTQEYFSPLAETEVVIDDDFDVSLTQDS